MVIVEAAEKTLLPLAVGHYCLRLSKKKITLGLYMHIIPAIHSTIVKVRLKVSSWHAIMNKFIATRTGFTAHFLWNQGLTLAHCLWFKSTFNCSAMTLEAFLYFLMHYLCTCQLQLWYRNESTTYIADGHTQQATLAEPLDPYHTEQPSYSGTLENLCKLPGSDMFTAFKFASSYWTYSLTASWWSFYFVFKLKKNSKRRCKRFCSWACYYMLYFDFNICVFRLSSSLHFLFCHLSQTGYWWQ